MLMFAVMLRVMASNESNGQNNGTDAQHNERAPKTPVPRPC